MTRRRVVVALDEATFRPLYECACGASYLGRVGHDPAEVRRFAWRRGWRLRDDGRAVCGECVRRDAAMAAGGAP